MSKGSNRRPGNEDDYRDNFDKIFSNKRPERGSFVYDPVSKSLVSKEDYAEMRESVNAPMIMTDIAGYQSMQTGEWIAGRRQHREHLKQHRLIELGNEKIPEQKPRAYNSDEVKRELAARLANY
ncbi:MAG: hypothetical protein KGI54_08920 [Pseudomonadota bacterium]|nr:hypothetical protein [Pseudomonadota bacterium]